jgi:mannose/fructose/N-acetylgalactosamine-specific phosphotransferase system component IIC
MKPNLKLMGIIVWAIGFALILYLLIQNNVVPYDQINPKLVISIEILGVVIMALGVLLIFIHNLVIVPREKRRKQNIS